MNTKTATVLIVLGIVMAVILIIVIKKSENKTINTNNVEEKTSMPSQNIPINNNSDEGEISNNINLSNDLVSPIETIIPTNPEFPLTGFKKE